MSERSPSRAAGWVVACFATSFAAAIGLAVVWWQHGPTQLAGLLLATSLAGFAGGLTTWANRLTPQGPFTEDRPQLAEPVERGRAEDDLSGGARLPRRGLVATTLAGAVVALGGALAVPFGSLGPRPGQSMLRTAWGRGRRAVDAEDAPVQAAAIPLGGMVTVFPEGDPGAADGQVVIVRVLPELLDLPEGRASWSVEGLVAYSKVCTHAGCPVGLYNSDDHELFCPCHQSSFDVLRGAAPTDGPAAWPLPQLPLQVDENGFVVAEGPLSEPVGPGWWRTS